MDAKVRSWKDLPSENWAEMMDFWHCHRPDDHISSQISQPTRVEFSSERICAKPALGLADATDFLLSKQDVSGIEVRMYLIA